MAGKLVFTLEEYKSAATKWRKELLMMPILGIRDMLQYLTQRPGIRGKDMVGSISSSAQFAPYKASRKKDADLTLKYREIETFFGSVVAEFEPNSTISTLLGLGATKGDAQAQTPSAKHVLACIADSLSENLYDSIWNGVRKADGDTTADLFNGFDTITKNEIIAAEISEAKQNLIKINTAITEANAVDIAKEIVRAQNSHLRNRDTFLFCSQDFADKYNEGYLMSHSGIPYNTKYSQVFIEGSSNRCTLVPLANKENSNYFHLTEKRNMLLGFDQMGDVEKIDVERFEPFVLSYIATMFFGVEFESIDSRRLLVAEISQPEA